MKFTPSDPKVEAFHRTLPHYCQTPLVSLPEIAKDIGVGHLLLKNESLRFGLPAFKILGASWATARVITKKLNLEIPQAGDGTSSSTYCAYISRTVELKRS
jgi:diaminopropionate ammonia-lyase